MKYTYEQLAKMIDHSLLHPTMTDKDLEDGCRVAAKFGVACSQPLVCIPASGPAPGKPRLALSSDKVVITAFKPSDDGKAWIVRLFGASGKTEKVKLSWASPAPRQVWLSDTSEQPREKVSSSVEVPGWGIVTLRAQ